MNDFDLEQLVIAEGLLPQESLDKALVDSRNQRKPLVASIVGLGLVHKDLLYAAIARAEGFKYAPLDSLQYNEELTKLLPLDIAQKTSSVPIRMESGVLHIALADPADLGTIDQVQMQVGFPLELYYAPDEDIAQARTAVYTKKETTEELLANIGGAGTEEAAAAGGDGSNIIKVVELIVSQAVRDHASDIHIEPEQDILRIRFRIDGILHEIPSPPKEWELPIISRIKVLSGMDIAESRVPQDGHFQTKVDEKTVDFRVSTLPMIYGENVVIRLLDSSAANVGLEKLGFTTKQDLSKYEDLISRPYGIILSTGPTGSGKTTTLYSALTRLNTIDRNIITIEDPVEYRLGLIRQIQVNVKAGITFANGLRAILRQDPDVIMVGEIRDLETAVTAIQAALTGHLVFSTLHTNDAPSSVTRLVNMGVEPFLISAALLGVMAQRLVRTICPKCKEPYEPSSAVMKKWGLENRPGLKLYRGKGCEACKGTGFKGRTGLYELLICDDELRETILANASIIAIRAKAKEKGMRTLSEDGLEKALAGMTTLEEVARVCEEHVELKAEVPAAALQPAASVMAVPSAKPAAKIEVKTADMAEFQKKIGSWLKKK
jgi:type IV pilus assembly protein PilB